MSEQGHLNGSKGPLACQSIRLFHFYRISVTKVSSFCTKLAAFTGRSSIMEDGHNEAVHPLTNVRAALFPRQIA